MIPTLGKHATAIILLGACALLTVLGQVKAADSQSPAWYVGVGAGLNWISNMNQEGWNRDHICYPVDDCTGNDIDGYRWFYDLDAERDSMFEIAIGRRFSNLRLELSANQRKNGIDQKFTNITYLDGSAITPDPTSDYTSQSMASIDNLLTRSLQPNVYYDFPLASSRITPYVGIGLGLSHVRLSRLFFRAEYSCSGACNAELSPPEVYNSWQDEHLSDSVFSKHLYAGADYKLNERFLLGLKLFYSLVNDMKDSGRYIEHPVPDLLNHTAISGIDHWSVTVNLKYFLGH